MRRQSTRTRNALLGARVPRRLLCPLAAASFAIVSQGAHAQPAADDAVKAEAKSYVDAGLAAQKGGHYDTAILLYEKAYELIPHPVLLFNMAQAHRLAGHREEALALYRKYLRTEPRGAEARTARELVAELEARLAKDSAKGSAAPRDPEGSDAPPDHGSHRATSRSADDRDTRRGTRARRGADRTESDADADDTGGTSGAEDASTGGEPRAPGTQAPGEPEHAEASAPGTIARAWSPARVDVGGSYASRSLTYNIRDGLTNPPASVATTTGAVRVEGELYPFALANPDHTLAGLGLSLTYDRAFAFMVTSRDGMSSASIDQSHTSLGARFRTGIGDASTVVFGIDYARRQYVLERSSIVGYPDVPDIDYASIDPMIGLDVPIATWATIFGRLDGKLVFDAGPLNDPTSYGKASMWGLDAVGGVELALSRQVRLRVTLEYSRISLSFQSLNNMTAGRDGDPSMQDVYGADDVSFGAAATLGLQY